MRADAPVEPAAVEHPLDLVGEQDQRRHARACCRSGPCASCRSPSAARGSRAASARSAPSSSLDALDRGRAQRGQPEAAVGGEALLRGEVVDVGLGGVERQAAGARGRVDEDERVARTPAGRRTSTMTPVEVSLWAQAMTSAPRVGDRLGRVAGLGLDHDRVGEERRAGGRLGELRGELAVDEMQGALAHQPGGGRVPEGGRAAVAEDDLVAVGQAEELADAVRGPGRPGRAPAAWRCEVPIRCGAVGELGERLGAHLRGPAAETAVLGLEVGGDLGGGRNGHGRDRLLT